MAKRTVQISKIRLDGNTQPRVELDEALIKEYQESYQAEATMPPLEVMFDGASYWLWDGFHRRWGAERAGLDKLPCNVTDGTQQDAQWASYGANAIHGLRRTNPDKQKAVKAALRHPNGPGKSNVEIAEHCGVDEKTVRKYRDELVSTSEIPKSDSRAGGDGRTIDTTNIGKTKPAPEVEPEDGYYDDPAEIIEGDAETLEVDDEDGAPYAEWDDARQRLVDWLKMQRDNFGLTPAAWASLLHDVAAEVMGWDG